MTKPLCSVFGSKGSALFGTTSSKFPIPYCRFPIANAAMTVPLKDHTDRWNTMFGNFLRVNYFKILKSPNPGLPLEDLQAFSVLLAPFFETSALLTPKSRNIDVGFKTRWLCFSKKIWPKGIDCMCQWRASFQTNNKATVGFRLFIPLIVVPLWCEFVCKILF